MKMAVARTLIRTKDAVEKETIAMVHSGNIKKEHYQGQWKNMSLGTGRINKFYHHQ